MPRIKPWRKTIPKWKRGNPPLSDVLIFSNFSIISPTTPTPKRHLQLTSQFKAWLVKKKYSQHLTPSSITSPEDMTHLEHRSFRASTTGLTCLAISGAATEESSAWLAIGGAIHWRVVGGFCRKHQLSLSWVSVVFEVDETMLFSGRFYGCVSPFLVTPVVISSSCSWKYEKFIGDVGISQRTQPQSWNLSRWHTFQPSILWTSFFVCSLSNPRRPWTFLVYRAPLELVECHCSVEPSQRLFPNSRQRLYLVHHERKFIPIRAQEEWTFHWLRLPSNLFLIHFPKGLVKISICIIAATLVSQHDLLAKKNTIFSASCEDSFWQQSEVDLCQVFFCGYFRQASLMASRGHRRWLHSYISLQGAGPKGVINTWFPCWYVIYRWLNHSPNISQTWSHTGWFFPCSSCRKESFLGWGVFIGWMWIALDRATMHLQPLRSLAVKVRLTLACIQVKKL